MDRYSHTFAGDMTAALHVLPDYSAGTKQVKATGTTDEMIITRENTLADCLALLGKKTGHSGILGRQTLVDGQGAGTLHKQHEQEETRMDNGESGIRTRGTGCNPYTGLANRRLQPLGHLSRESENKNSIVQRAKSQ